MADAIPVTGDFDCRQLLPLSSPIIPRVTTLEEPVSD